VSQASWLDPWVRAFGFALAGAALLLLVWAIRGDRSRGRRRCPRCWYDMAGINGRVCPECGRSWRNEKRLRAPRRRWRWAAFALAMVGAGLATAAWPKLRGEDWVKQVPGWLLVRMAPIGSAAGWMRRDPLQLELISRLQGLTLSDPQLQYVFDCYLRSFPEDLAQSIRVRPRWPSDTPVLIREGPPPRLLWAWGTPTDVSYRVRAHSAEGAPGAFHALDELRSVCALDAKLSEGPLVLDIEIWDQGRRLWSGTRSFPCVFEGSISAAFSPVASPVLDERLRDYLEPRLVQRGLPEPFVVIEDPYVDSRFGLDTAFGYRIEVLRDGAVVATGIAAHARARVSDMETTTVLLDWKERSPQSLEGNNWSIRVTGDAAAALLDSDPMPTNRGAAPYPKKYWAGSFTVPVTHFVE
jgi:hypothetical protein